VFIECTNPSTKATPETRALIRKRTLALARQSKLRGRRGPTDPSRSGFTTFHRGDSDSTCSHVSDSQDKCSQCHASSQSSESSPPESFTPAFASPPTLTMRVPHDSTQDPFGALAAGDAGDLTHLGRWFFYSQLDASNSAMFHKAVTSFGQDLWEMSRRHEPLLYCLIASVFRKKSFFQDSEGDRHWLFYKGKVLSMIQRAIRQGEGSRDPLLWVAIVFLSTFDIGDRHFETAVTHLRGLRDMIHMEQLTDNQWMYCAYTDFRVALMLNIKPVLPYYITPYYRMEHPLILSRRPEARRLALHNSKFSPRGPMMKPEASFDLFRKLHGVSLAWESLNASDRLPFGEVYDLEYSILSLNANAAASSDPSAFTIELLACAAELHVLALTRFWTPQRQQTPISVLRRAQARISQHRSLLSDWQRYAHASSLLWVLFALLASMSAFGLSSSHSVPVLQLLHDTLAHLRMKSSKRFVTELRKWPWLEHWHDDLAERTWVQSSVRKDGPAGPWQRLSGDQREKGDSRNAPKRDRLYIGALQFYTGA